MAGGPNAAIVACLFCFSAADRVGEGIEDDSYLCRECGKGFGIDWRRGGPEKPCWPLTPEERALAEQLLALRKKGTPPAGPG